MEAYQLQGIRVRNRSALQLLDAGLQLDDLQEKGSTTQWNNGRALLAGVGIMATPYLLLVAGCSFLLAPACVLRNASM